VVVLILAPPLAQDDSFATPVRRIAAAFAPDLRLSMVLSGLPHMAFAA
jgi:hypothetical protein